MDGTFINLRVVNKAKLPKSTNLKTINGESLIACGDGCEDIVIGTGTTSDVLIDGGTFLAPTNSVLIDGGSFI